jgi:hypothetical protein
MDEEQVGGLLAGRRPVQGPAEEAAREGVGRHGVGESGDRAAVFRGVVLLLTVEAAADLVAVDDEVRGAGDQDSSDDQGGCVFGLHRSLRGGGGVPGMIAAEPLGARATGLVVCVPPPWRVGC